MNSESELFEQWFRIADGNNDGRVEGSEAVQFFQRSGLPKEALRENNGGTFTQQQARAVIVGTAPPLPTPKLQGLTPETWQPGAQSPRQFPTGIAPTTGLVPGSQWPPLSPVDFTRLEQMFVHLDTDFDGILQGSDCFQAFMQMGVERAVLKSIWSTVAGDMGYLNKEQFVKCVYLIENAQKGIPPPVTLPPEPFPPIAQPNSATALARASSLGQQAFPTLPPQATFQPPGATPYHPRGTELSDRSMSMLAPVERGRLDAERESALVADQQLYEEEGKLATAREKREFYEKSLQDIVLFKRRVGNKLLEVQEQERKAAQEAEEAEKMYQQARAEADEAAQESGAIFDKIRQSQERRSEVEMMLHTLQKEVAEMEGAHPQDVQKIEAEIQGLHDEVAATEARKQGLLAQIESYKKQQASLAKWKEDLQLICAAAEAEVRTAASDIEKIKNEVEDVKSSEDIDQIQKLLREAARVYSNLHAHALKAGIEIPKETRLMLYGQDLMYAGDMIGSNVEMEDWNEDGFIIVDAFPDVKDELDKALFDAVMSSSKGTPHSKVEQSQGFEINFDSSAPDLGMPFSASSASTPMNASNPKTTLPNLFAMPTDPPKQQQQPQQQDASADFGNMFGSDPFVPAAVPASDTPAQSQKQSDPFSALPASGKTGQANTGFAVSFDDGAGGGNLIAGFGDSTWPAAPSQPADPPTGGSGQSGGIIPPSQDPFPPQDKSGEVQAGDGGDNPFGDSAFA